MITKRRRAYLQSLINPVTAKHLEIAKWLWEQNQIPVDSSLAGFLNLSAQTEGLKFARQSLLLSLNEVAKKMGVDRSTYFRMEKSERSGTLQIKNLQRAAEAMGCELIYAVVPQKRKLFSEILWGQLIEKSKVQVSNRKHIRGMTPHLLVSFAKRLLVDSKFRRSQGWTERLQMSQEPQGET